MDGNLVGCQLVIDLSHSFDLVLNLFLVKGVNEDLHVLLSVKGHSGGLAGDSSGVALFNIKLELTSIL